MEERGQKKHGGKNALKKNRNKKNAIIVVKHLFKWKVNRGQYWINAQNQWRDESI